MSLFYWTTSGQNFSKIKQYLGEQKPKQKQKGVILWMLNKYKKL